MKLVMSRTRDALLLINLTLPAVAQNDGPDVGNFRQVASFDNKLPQKAYQGLRQGIVASQAAKIEGLEPFPGQPQLVVGGYPLVYSIKERQPLKDSPFEAALEIAARFGRERKTFLVKVGPFQAGAESPTNDHSGATWWINLPQQELANRLNPGLELLKLPKKEIFGVTNDSVKRAVELGLLTLDGEGIISVDAASPGAAPFEIACALSGSTRNSPSVVSEYPVTPSGISFSDTSLRSRPEVAAGELRGRNLVAGPGGLDKQAGLIDLKGMVENATSTTEKVAWKDPTIIEEVAKTILELQKKISRVAALKNSLSLAEKAMHIRPNIGAQRNQLKDAEAELAATQEKLKELQEKLSSSTRDEVTTKTEHAAVQGRAFVGPVGTKSPQNSEELLAFCQNLIEAGYREKTARILEALVGDGTTLFGSEPDTKLALLASERSLMVKRSGTAPLKNVEEVRNYLVDLASGLTDDAVIDLRRLADEMIARAKGEREKLSWYEVKMELDRVVPEVQTLRKSDPYFPESRRINWSRFKFVLPLEIIAPGMLYERLRLE